MTRDEWSELSYLTFGEWWDTPQTEEREQVWFDQLSHHDREAVYRAFQELLRDSPRFPPRLGEVIAKLEPSPAAFDEVWAAIQPVLRKGTTYDDQRVAVREVAELAGSLVAGWVATYGIRRLALEPVFDPEFGGAVLKRLASSYDGLAGTAHGRQVAIDRAQRVIAELERPVEQRALPAGVER